MRDYGIVSPKFWIGKTGRELRKHPYAQRIAMYLMSAPTSEMTGVFYCPMMSIWNDVGSPFEGASEGLGSPYEGDKNPLGGVKAALLTLSKLDFCCYDFECEFVFVKEMARWQIAESLKPADNRIKGILKYIKSMPEPLATGFVERYNDDFCLGFDLQNVVGIPNGKPSPSEAPSKPLARGGEESVKPLRSQEQDQEQKQEKEKDQKEKSDTLLLDDSETVAVKTKKPSRKKANTVWPGYETIPDEWRKIVEQCAPDLDPVKVFESFRDYSLAKDVRYADWTAAFRNSVKSIPEWKRATLKEVQTHNPFAVNKSNGHRCAEDVEKTPPEVMNLFDEATRGRS